MIKNQNNQYSFIATGLTNKPSPKYVRVPWVMRILGNSISKDRDYQATSLIAKH